MNKNQDTNQEQQENPNFEKKNYLEWSVFGLGLILILSVMGYLVYQIYTQNSIPADINVEYSLDPTQNNLYRYKLTAMNSGGETVENVVIELSLVKADSALEKSEISFQYIPKESQRIGWITFNTNPSEADSVVTKVISFSKAS